MKNSLSALFLARTAALAACLLVISGCSTLTSDKPAPPAAFDQWHAHQEKIISLDQWMIEGRLFLKTSKDGFSSSFIWRQQSDNYQIDFSAPMNQGSYHLTGSPEKVTIRLPDNSLQSANDPETLMKKTLGFKLPIKGLHYWLRGIPDPLDTNRGIVLDRDERLSKLSQAGWDIQITQYILSKGYQLPKKLTMENSHLKVKLAIKQWTFTE